MNAGIIGCGNISGAYLKNLRENFRNIAVKSCADLDAGRARARAAEYPGARACTPGEMLADPGVEIVVNLTTPRGHFPVAMQAIAAGKHVYNEKPLALAREEGAELLAAAERAGVRVGAAPDTFLGAGIQTSRRLVDSGAIGEPVGAQAFYFSRGHESWHPDPDFYYQPGGGPMFDMGPYYLTALVALLGPVRRVTGTARVTFPRRVIASAPRRGESISVNVPTHVTGIMDFEGGLTGTIATSFDVWASETPCIEIFGSEGTISVPDPNQFGGPVRMKRMSESAWREVPLDCGFERPGRGIGLSDMADAIARGRPHRASGEMAGHVLDLMHAFHDASRNGRHVDISSRCARPEAMPPGLFDGRW